MSPFGRTLVTSLFAAPLVAGLMLPLSPATALEPGAATAVESATSPGDPTVTAVAPADPTPAPVASNVPAAPVGPPATVPTPEAPGPENSPPSAAPDTPASVGETPVAPAAPTADEPVQITPDPPATTNVMGYAVEPEAFADSPVVAWYETMGGADSWLGAPLGPERVEADGIRVLDLQRGSIYYSSSTGPRVVAGEILTRYRQTGEFRGPLGLPVADETAGERNSRVSTFQQGRIYYTPGTGAREVYGPILARYLALGGENGGLGLPTSGEVAAGRGGRMNNFQGGRIYHSAATGTHEVYGAILARYLALGADSGGLGLPTSGEVAAGRGGRMNNFQGGRIYYSAATGTHEVYGAILGRYLGLGAENGVLGLPTSGEVAAGRGSRLNTFQGGHIYYSAATGTHEVYGAILMNYLQAGGPDGRLGLPVSGEIPWDYGRQSRFQGGTITWNAFTGEVRAPFDVDPAVLAQFSPQVAQWGPTVAQALGDLGLDQRYVYGVLRQIRQESGGNPNAVNNNDSNWAAGYASFGLLQTIAPTYQSFAPPGQRGSVTWVTVNGRAQRFVPEMVVPYNNIYAGLNYAKTRYGVARFEAWNRGQNYAY